ATSAGSSAASRPSSATSTTVTVFGVDVRVTVNLLIFSPGPPFMPTCTGVVRTAWIVLVGAGGACAATPGVEDASQPAGAPTAALEDHPSPVALKLSGAPGLTSASMTALPGVGPGVRAATA